MDANQIEEEAIFHAARRIGSREARDAYLIQVCGGDEARRGRLEGLLRVQDQEASFLEVAPFDATTGFHDSGGGPGVAIGPYKLLEPIGEGGMGTVYSAEQQRPVRRQVALKVIKPGMDSKQVLARFEAERQALALMDHPNIAKVLDAGSTDGGRPYFVMELVRGLPITAFCDHHQLAVRDRLDLFVQVCRAVQHAHQKGIIHRDLKPSNVLLTVADGLPVPKVIDFGVAKATGQSLTERTLFTGLHQVVGTPLYMSPEQADLSSADVDTRSDVYSLGVLLYELLTGTTPFDAETIRAATFDEMRRILREQEPPRPSTRLTDQDATVGTVSSNRKSDPRQLTRDMRGELDWIAMKALEKDRRRRYQTANDLAADVARYLADEPVEACPPSAWYRFSKHARRHRVALTTASLVGLVLVAGTAASLWQAAKSRASQAWAESERDRALRAEREATVIRDFLLGDLLLQAGRTRQKADTFEADPDLTVREALDRAAARIGDRFRDQPLLESALRQTIGLAYQDLGQDAPSASHFERAVRLRTEHLGPDHPDTQDSLWSLATSYRLGGRAPEAIPILERILGRRRATFGPDDLRTVDAEFALGDAHDRAGRPAEAERLMRVALARSGGRDRGLANAFTVRQMKSARGLLARRKYAEAVQVLREVVEIRSWSMADEWSRFYAMSLLGEALMGTGDSDAAGPLILGGYDGMRQREARIRSFNKPLLAEAAERAAMFRETAGKPDSTRRWRERTPPAQPDPVGLR